MRATVRTLPAAIVFAGALVAGCAGGPSVYTASPASSSTSASGGPAKPPANAATKAASAKANLAIEKLRLSELFKGTPVVIALLQDGSLRIDVPLQYSFDPGKSAIKPPLAAVLDKVAAGQLDEVTHLLISTTGDPGGRSATLVGERGASVRDHLVGRGLPLARLAAAAAVTGVVRVVVTDAPAP